MCTFASSPSSRSTAQIRLLAHLPLLETVAGSQPDMDLRAQLVRAGVLSSVLDACGMRRTVDAGTGVPYGPAFAQVRVPWQVQARTMPGHVRIHV